MKLSEVQLFSPWRTGPRVGQWNIGSSGRSDRREGPLGQRTKGAEPLAIFLLLGALLILPALANGLPFPSADTASYLRVGAGAASVLERLVFPAAEGEPLSAGRPLTPEDERLGATYLAVRSPWYSFVAWLLSRAGGLWSIAVVQAAIAAGLVLVAMRLLAPTAGIVPLAVVAVALGIGSTLGIYVSTTMPDVFVGFGVLAAGLVLVWGDRLRPLGRASLSLLVTAAAAAHPTHAPVILFAMIVLALGSWLVPGLRAPSRNAFVTVVAATLAGAAAILLAREVGSHILGERLRYPPLLMARLVADGPGRTFLEQACSSRPLALCAYRDRPLDDAQTILWDPDPARGVFSPADPATRVRLIEEERELVLGALRTDPWGVLRTALGNTTGLLFSLRLEGEVEHVMPARALAAFEELLPGTVAAWQRSAVVRGSWPFALLDTWLAGTAALAFLFLLWWVTVGGRRLSAEAELGRHRALFVFCLAGLVMNAAICGIISGPLPRYHMRILWLVPACALFFALALTDTAARVRPGGREPTVTAGSPA